MIIAQVGVSWQVRRPRRSLRSVTVSAPLRLLPSQLPGGLSRGGMSRSRTMPSIPDREEGGCRRTKDPTLEQMGDTTMRAARWAAIAAAGAAVLTTARPAGAVPAFARREGVLCQMCHFRPPELNQDGHEYLHRGLREEPGEGAREEAEGGAAVLGQAGAIRWDHYLSVVGDEAFVNVEHEGATFDAGEVSLLVGGPFDSRWSALAHAAFNAEEGGSEVESVWGMYVAPWEHRLGSARFGKLMPDSILLNQGDITLPLSTPLVLSVPTEAGSGWTPTTMLRGAEVGAVDARWNAYLGAAQPQFEEGDEGDPHTDLYASAEYLFTPRGDSLTAYGYWGATDLPPEEEQRDFHRWGLFGNIYYQYRTKAVVGYLAGSDEAPDGTDLDTSGYFLLWEQLLTDRWAAYARWDWLKQDRLDGGSETVRGPTLGASFWAQTHAWLTAEAQFLNELDETGGNTYTVQLTWAF